MTEPSPSANPDLATITDVARILNVGSAPEEALAAAADRLREGLGIERATIWLHEAHASTFRAITSPRNDTDLALRRGQTAVPPRDPLVHRVHVVHEGQWLGVLDASGAPLSDAAREVLDTAAEILAPFLGSIELSEDLAYEVELRARQVEQQRRFISMIIDCLPVGLYVVDREYRIQIWNRRREMGTQGLRRDEVVGRPVFDVLTRQPAGEMKEEFDSIFATGEVRQMELEVPYGPERRVYRISKIPMRLEGDEITHVITIGEDVTLWHTVQQQILQSEKLSAMGQLAAGVMHEINNPLATISACIAALESRLEDFPEPGRTALEEYLEIIDKEVLRCTSIVDGLLDFARPKGKTKALIAINPLVEDALFLLKHHKGYKRLQLQRELAGDLPDVFGNNEQLIQVFMAMMLNAVDAMEGGGRLTVRTSFDPAMSDELCIEISDTGIGIPHADLSRIFEPFYTTKPPGRGTGLGLSICYGIIAEHGGHIDVESEPGRGSTFRICLPVVDPGRPTRTSR
ncbi:MAG: nitrogen regulation protein NR(II) [Gemmatimonadales bacterium]